MWVNLGYQRWKSAARSSLRTRVRICRSRCAPRICLPQFLPLSLLRGGRAVSLMNALRKHSGGQCGKYLAASMRIQLDLLERHSELTDRLTDWQTLRRVVYRCSAYRAY